MRYATAVLRPDEQIVFIGRLHWIVYARAIRYGLGAALLLVLGWVFPGVRLAFEVVAAVMFVFAMASYVRARFVSWITEFVVTDRRVIYKHGFISRHTVEMNMDQVESVDVTQSVLGRLLDYGTIHVHGTGSGIEHLHGIATPIRLRSAIIAK